MFHKLIPGRALAALLVGGTLAVTQLVGPTTVTSAPDLRRVADYPAKIQTTTDVTLNKRAVRRGQPILARVKVRSGVGTPKGTVTIKLAGRSWTVKLRDGRATKSLPTRNLRANRTYTVRAVYNGTDRFKKSNDADYFTVKKRKNRRGQVAGVEESRGNDNGAGAADNDGANRPPAVAGVESDAAAGLGDTGAGSNLGLYGLVGLGLLGAGGLTIVARRLRA
jgi:hypothetical protein